MRRWPINLSTNMKPMSITTKQMTLKAIICKAPVPSFGGRNLDSIAV